MTEVEIQRESDQACSEGSRGKASMADAKRPIEWKRPFYLLLGVALFTVVYLSPDWPSAIDPQGKEFPLSRRARRPWACSC